MIIAVDFLLTIPKIYKSGKLRFKIQINQKTRIQLKLILLCRFHVYI